MVNLLLAATPIFYSLIVVGNAENSVLVSEFPSSLSNVSDSDQLTIAGMNDAISQLLLGKTALAGTPYGEIVQKVDYLLTKVMMPKVKAAHNADQSEVNSLGDALAKCGRIKRDGFQAAEDVWEEFEKWSKSHKKCRGDEAVELSEKMKCLQAKKAAKDLKVGACKHFAAVSSKWGTQKANLAIVKKAGGESTWSYITRMETTICGNHVHGPKGHKNIHTDGWGGGLRNGALDIYLRAKAGCSGNTDDYKNKVKECKRIGNGYVVLKGKCDQYQDLMDSVACRRATMAKDTCERYTECYWSTLASLGAATKAAKSNAIDRKAEWRGLKRIKCFISAFADGKVTHTEVDACKMMKVNTNLFTIKPAPIAKLPKCAPKFQEMYPATGAYKKAQIAPLPVLAKGKPLMQCSGIEDISLTPRKGSPKSCKCFRVVLHAPYSTGALVKCSKCLDVHRATETNSCPLGTKIFSPRSRNDWETFLKSAGPVRAPHWIVDVTRPQNGCGGCAKHAMHSGNRKQKSWHTSDGSPWWLRSTGYGKQNADYTANCFMNLGVKNKDANQISFSENKCKYHSKSYYCQAKSLDLSPRRGSPKSCRCSKVQLSGRYSPGILVKCEQCLSVSKSTQKSSCPSGFKIFSPRSRGDWKTFLDSAGPLRAPHFIVDITRPQNGCGGCSKYPMRSSQPQQATWRTADGSSWWLRSTVYSEPNGDYQANCYLDLWGNPASMDHIKFNDHNCNYHSRSYYCQVVKPKR